MAEFSSERDIIAKVRQDMLDSGWKNYDILENPKIPSREGYSLRADFVLLSELYPLAIVEVKSSHSADLSGALDQASHYAKQIDLTLVLATNGASYISRNISDRETKTWEKFPTPKEVLTLLDCKFAQDDPRLLPAPTSPNKLRLHHTLAIKENLDAILEGKKTQVTVMSPGTGSTFVISQIIRKLLAGSQYRRVIYVSDRIVHLEQTHHVLAEYEDLKLFLSRDLDVDRARGICFLTTHRFRKLKDEILNPENDYRQILITHHVKLSGKLEELVDKIPHLQVLSLIDQLPKGEEDYRGREEAENGNSSIQSYKYSDFVVPEDHEVLSIMEVSQDISRGISLFKHGDNLIVEDDESIHIEKSALLLNGRNILSNGEIDYSTSIKTINIDRLEPSALEKYLVKPGDILIPSVSRELSAIAIAPEVISRSLLVGNALVRIRINPEKAIPRFVFSFLRSDIGKSLLKRNASSFRLNDVRISVQSISKTAIFLPPLSKQHSADNSQQNTEESPKNEFQYVEDEFSNLTFSIRQIEDEILPQLKELNLARQSAFTTQDELSRMTFRLRQIASSLAPAPLSERVVNEYPTPIALAYRRFYDSRFNVYEKTQRLRDLFETSFVFIYNLVLADWLKNLDPINYFIVDKGARRSYKTFALARKNDFLKGIIKASQNNPESDLFLSEIVTSSLTEFFDSLKDLRNHLSHSATATRSKQEKILSDNEPIILDLLESLDFLRQYSLVRVPLSYRKGGKEIYRMEVYKGVAPQLEERPIEEDGELEEESESESLKMAEHDHLVLLRKDGKILDLHPFYQLIDNEKTQYQPHIWFFKQRSESQKENGSIFEKQITLKGESISNSETISLRGTEEFENLLGKILETKPK